MAGRFPVDSSSRVLRSSFPRAEGAHFRTASWFGPEDHEVPLEPHFPTVLHAFVHAARPGSHQGVTLLPDDPAGAEEFRSYRALVGAAQTFAARLAAKDIRPGDRVLVVLPTGFEYIISFFGCQLAGAVPVPSYPPAALEKAELSLDRLSHIGEASGARFCVTNRALRPLLGEVALRVRTVEDILTVEGLGAQSREADFPARARPDDIAFLQYTSGSTGDPKGVRLSHHNLVYNIHGIGMALWISRRDVGVSWLPLYHDMGLIGVLLFCVYWRIPVVLMSPTAFLMRPHRWLKAISDHGGTLSPAPNFGYARCLKRVTDEQAAGLDLSSWRYALNGAEPVSADTCERFIERFGAHGFAADAMLPVYGLAEASLAVTFTPAGQALRCERLDRAALAEGEATPSEAADAVRVVSCGAPIPGNEVVVVDEDGALLGDRRVGHIVAHGPSIMSGYFGAPEASQQILEEGWLWTGDLGFLLDGQLYVTGRVKDLIIVRGKNYYAEDLERRAEEIRGVRAGCTVAFGVQDEARGGERVVLVAETRISEPPARAVLAEMIIEAVAQGVGVRLDEVVLVEPGAVPKTSSGKRQRAKTRALYLEGGVKVISTSRRRLAVVLARARLGLVKSRARRWLGRRKPD